MAAIAADKRHAEAGPILSTGKKTRVSAADAFAAATAQWTQKIADRSQLFDAFERHLNVIAEQYEKSVYPDCKGISYGDARYTEQTFTGDIRLANLRRDLRGFPKQWLPTEMQMKIHETAFQAEASMIYRKEYFVNRKTILERNKWKSMISLLLVLTPRKFGKTYVFFLCSLLVRLIGRSTDGSLANTAPCT